jgi:hypothetical protein
MTREELKAFGFSHEGDIIAVVLFSKTEIEKLNPSLDDLHRVGRLTEKTSSFPQKLPKAHKWGSLVGNKNAKKKILTIYIGWLMAPGRGKESKPVRERSGGGKRKLKVDINLLVSDLVDVSKGFFFPDNVSKFGTADEFEFEMCSFDERVVPPQMTVDDICHKAGFENNINFYLRSTRITPADRGDQGSSDNGSDNEKLPDLTSQSGSISDSEDFQTSTSHPEHVAAGTPTVRFYISY